MTKLIKCKCGNYLSDCSCVITKMDLRTPPTMKEQIIEDFKKEFGSVLPTDNAVYILDAVEKWLENRLDHLTAEQGKPPRKKKLSATSQKILDEVRLSPELTADQGDGIEKLITEQRSLTYEEQKFVNDNFWNWIDNNKSKTQGLTVREVSDEEIEEIAEIKAHKYDEGKFKNGFEVGFISGAEWMRDKMNSLKTSSNG